MSKAERIKEIRNIMENFGSKYTIIDKEVLDVPEYLRALLKESESLEFHEGIFKCYQMLAAHYIVLDESTKAYENLSKAREIIDCRQIDESFYGEIANIYIMYFADLLADFDTSVEYYEWGLSYATKAAKGFDTVNLKMNFGSLCIDNGLYEEGLRVLEEANVYLVQNDYQEYLTYTYDNTGRGLLGLGDLDGAMENFAKAYKLAETYKNYQMIISASIGKARVLVARGERDLAIDFLTDLTESIDINKGGNENVEVAIELASLLIAKGAYQQADRHLTRYEDRMEHCMSNELRYQYYDLLSIVKEYQNKFNEALIYARIAHARHVDMLSSSGKILTQQALENNYKTRVNVLKEISETGDEINRYDRLDEVVLRLNERLKKTFRLDMLGIGIISGDRIHFSHFVNSDVLMPAKILPLEPMTTLAGWVVEKDEIIIVRDLERQYGRFFGDQLVKSIYHDEINHSGEIRSLMYAPIHYMNQTVGVFTVQSSELDVYSSEEFELFKIICSYVAPAIGRAQKLLDSEKG